LTGKPIECSSLTKIYGDLAAVSDLSFSVEPGTITGFVGHNGAGKTTTIRMLLGLAHPTSGEAYLLGKSCGSKDRSHLAGVGYLPEAPAFHKWMKPWEFLVFVGDTLGLDHREAKARSLEMLELFGLGHKTNHKIQGFSKGEKQRLGLAQAMIGDPELLLLDEPTSGLDPIGRHELIAMISNLRGELTIFLSSHLLVDIEKVCDHVIMIRKGKMIEAGSLHQVIDRNSPLGFAIQVLDGRDSLVRALETEEWAGEVSLDGERVRLRNCNVETAGKEMPRIMAELGLSVVMMEMTRDSLQEVYVKLAEERDEP
jgi:ABC-2 type transport system ATP-binding protein